MVTPWDAKNPTLSLPLTVSPARIWAQSWGSCPGSGRNLVLSLLEFSYVPFQGFVNLTASPNARALATLLPNGYHGGSRNTPRADSARLSPAMLDTSSKSLSRNSKHGPCIPTTPPAFPTERPPTSARHPAPPSSSGFGLSRGVLGPSWGRLGAVLGPSWALLGRPGAILGLPGGLLTLSWDGLGGTLGNL